MTNQLFRMALAAGLLFTAQLWALSKTMGTPLGGIGTGYVKYNAITGDFAASSRIPPGAGDMICEFPVRMSTSSGFHFFAGGQSVTKAKTELEDAKCPLYTANFGNTNGVDFSLNSFGPYIPGDGDLNYQLAASPSALFEIVAKNSGAAPIDVAVALEFTNKSTGTSGLLGGANDAVLDPASGNRGISFTTSEFSDLSPNNIPNSGNAYLLSGCSKDGATFSAGSLGDFTSSGTLSATGNCVAAKCSIAPGESVSFKYVISWWRTFVSNQDRYSTGKNDEDQYYYHNFYQNSQEVAAFCMQHFDTIRNSVLTMVNRVMGSNFPDWYKDRLLNNTYPLIHNSLWAKDGRSAYWEGKYGIIGTIDQGQHAAIWYVHNWPRNQWNELAYWLSNAFQSPQFKGQIHHDFNISPGMTFNPPESRFMAPWDHWNRPDYWFQPETMDWSDLNSMLIFKAYELMLVTGRRDSLQKYFPKICETADRIYTMSEEAGSYIPITSRSTYDSDGSLTPQYACGCAVAAYKLMAEMAKFVGDNVAAEKYEGYYTHARQEFREKLFNEEFGAIMNMGWGEGHVGGYSWASYFCIPPIMDQDFIETGCDRLWNMYSTASDLQTKLGGWHFYTYDHLGGALTAIGRADQALQFHKWDHELNYDLFPDQVFWQELFTNEIGPQKYASYMTGPSVWRSYLQFIGYMLDRAHNRVFIRPSLPTEMGNKIVNAPVPSPYGWGMINYDGNGNPGKNSLQDITIAYDIPTAINAIVLKNTTSYSPPHVTVANSAGEIGGLVITEQDYGHEKNVHVFSQNPIIVGPEGITISLLDAPAGVKTDRLRSSVASLSISSSTLMSGKPIQCSIDRPGKVTMTLFALNGAKIGKLFEGKIVSTGKQSLAWTGKTVDGKKIGTVAGVLHLSTPGGTISRLVFNAMK